MTLPQAPLPSRHDGPQRRPLAHRVLAPLRRTAHSAPAGGLVLLACAAAAMALANSPWAHSYHALWETPVSVALGTMKIRLTLHQVINDGLMAVFFFYIGLEIKREVLVGDLASRRQAALPVAAALGGMVVPALFYLMLNPSGPGTRGWGIPMATDIAFALGVLALLGNRVSPSLKIFLSALAIADDMGAVLVIAIFYTSGVAWGALGTAGALLLLSFGANAAGVRATWAYALIGLALWVAVLLSGVHATVAGVLLALTIPSRTRIDEAAFLGGAERALSSFHASFDRETTVLSNRAHQAALHALERLTEQAQPPLARLEHGLHAFVTFGIMPLFALANAGLSLGGAGDAIFHPVSVGVFVGLLLGKPIGISLLAWLAVRTKVASLPTGMTWPELRGVSLLGGVGFTMSLFIAGLAFGDQPQLLGSAKLGILVASLLAGVGGWLMLRSAPRKTS